MGSRKRKEKMMNPENIQISPSYKERFEEAVVRFIERETEEPSNEETIKILPEMAHTLVAFWGINRPSH